MRLSTVILRSILEFCCKDNSKFLLWASSPHKSMLIFYGFYNAVIRFDRNQILFEIENLEEISF